MVNCKAIVIGASAGGFDALGEIFTSLVNRLYVPIIISQHLDPNSDDFFSIHLNRLGSMSVAEARDKEPLLAGRAYIAPADYHLLVEEDKTLSLSKEERVQWSRPSIDVLFESAAEAFQTELVGVLLTGANSDGSEGIARIKELGGFTVVQDPRTAQSPFMPNQAMKKNKVDAVLSLEEIVVFISTFKVG